MRHIAAALIVLVSLSSLACNATEARETSAAIDAAIRQPAPVRCAAPVLITVHRDVSRSTGPTGVPPVTENDMRALVDGTVRVCGGELLYGEIGTNSFRPFDRLRIDEPPPYPDPPTFDSNAFIRAEQEEQQAARIHTWESLRQAWITQSESDTAAFLARLHPRLQRAPLDDASDVYGAVERAISAMSEPDDAWSVPPLKVIFMATDGQHTTKRAPVAAIPPGVTMLVAGSAGCLEHFAPTVFEGTAAAVRHVRLLSQQEEQP